MFRNSVDAVPEPLAERLAEQHRHAVMRLLGHEHALQLIGKVLNGRQWLIWRGLHLGRAVYADPLERTGTDIDLLIPADGRDDVLHALTRAGFERIASVHTDTHSASLVGHHVAIDLHWHVLRPGRTRADLTPWCFEHVTHHASIPVLDSTATFVTLVLHTAITEHVTNRLVRAVDIDRVSKLEDIDWDEARDRIRSSGLAAGAWAQLAWTRALFGTHTPITDSIAPSGLRRTYLQGWLAADPGALYERYPDLVRAAFSLALQDAPRDVARALVGFVRAGLPRPV